MHIEKDGLLSKVIDKIIIQIFKFFSTQSRNNARIKLEAWKIDPEDYFLIATRSFRIKGNKFIQLEPKMAKSPLKKTKKPAIPRKTTNSNLKIIGLEGKSNFDENMCLKVSMFDIH